MPSVPTFSTLIEMLLILVPTFKYFNRDVTDYYSLQAHPPERLTALNGGEEDVEGGCYPHLWIFHHIQSTAHMQMQMPKRGTADCSAK